MEWSKETLKNKIHFTLETLRRALFFSTFSLTEQRELTKSLSQVPEKNSQIQLQFVSIQVFGRSTDWYQQELQSETENAH